jgi:glycosyltransferase involved in cell wall biosynthesis
MLASSTALEPGWLARLAQAVDGTAVTAASALVVHPLRPTGHATPDDGRVRNRGLLLSVERDAPVLRAEGAGAPVTLDPHPSPIAGASAACLLVDRRAYEAAGALPDYDDIDVAVFELCRRLRARGGEVVLVPDAVVVDQRGVATPRALGSPVATNAPAWQAYVEAHGPDLMRAADPLLAGRRRFALTVAAPSEKVAPRWGDWHLALAFARALRRRGHVVRVQTLDHADDLAGRACDVHLVVRGISPVRRTPGQAHVLWIISHPEQVSTAECDDADLVLVASVRFADELRARTRTPIEVMLQATDVTRFHPMPPQSVHAHDVAVVAKSRDVFRTSVADAIAGGLRPAIYGSGWEPFLDPALVVSDYVANEELPVVYSSVGVLLNDHWQTMYEWGFVSNRLFDALACETTVISDDLPEIAELFEGAVLTYNDAGQLRALIASTLADRTGARARAARGRQLIEAHHTFDHRAAQLLDALDRHGLTH